MGIMDNILREVGLSRTRRTKRRSGLHFPPSPGEIKEQAEKIMSGLSELKEVPKALMDKAVEAEEEFRSADKAFRGTRFKGKGRR